MPLDPKKEIDLSTLALVEKKGLIDELGKRLKEVTDVAISESIKAAIKAAQDEFDDLKSFNDIPSWQPPNSQQSSKQNSPQANQQQPNAPQQRQQSSGGGRRSGGGPGDDFNKQLKLQAGARDIVDKLVALQKKKDKDARMKSLKGNVYSDTGKGYAEDVDELSSQYQTFDVQGLEDAQRKLSDIQEGIRFSTFGKENELLTKATANLQKELEAESKKRNTTLGKIGNFLDRENINAASIITGIFSDSPMIGLLTKATLEGIRHYRLKAQKQKSDKLKFGDIKSKLPRPDLEVEADDVKLQEKTFEKLAGKDPELVYASLKESLDRGAITSEQFEKLKVKYVAPGFHPLSERMGQGPQLVQPNTNSPERQTQTQQYTPTPEPYEQKPALRNHETGDAIPDHKTHKDDAALKTAFYETNQDRAIIQEEADWKRDKKEPVPEWRKDYDLFEEPTSGTGSTFGDYSPPSHLTRLRKDIAQQRPEEREPLQMLRSPERMREAPVMRMAAQTSGTEILQDQNPETQLHPTPDEPNNVVSILEGMKETEKAESKKSDIWSFRNRNNRLNPLLEIRQLSRKQLLELQKINDALKIQIDQGDLAADAKLRDTHPDKELETQDLLAGGSKKSSGGGHGIAGGIAEIVAGGSVASVLTLMRQKFVKLAKLGGSKLKSLFGFGKTGEEVGEGLATGSRIAKVGTEGAEEAGMVTKIAKVGAGAAEEGGLIAKAAKMGGIAKIGLKIGKFSGWLLIALAVVDAVTGFFQAGSILKKAEKDITIIDRFSGGVYGLVKGFVGILDFLTGLVGLKTDIGGFFGKMAMGQFRQTFHAVKLAFTVMWKGFQMMGYLLKVVLSPFIKSFQDSMALAQSILQPFFDVIGNFFNKISAWSDEQEKMNDDIQQTLENLDPEKMISDFVDMMKTGVDEMGKAIHDGFDYIINKIKNLFGYGTKEAPAPTASPTKKSFLGSLWDKVTNLPFAASTAPTAPTAPAPTTTPAPTAPAPTAPATPPATPPTPAEHVLNAATIPFSTALTQSAENVNKSAKIFSTQQTKPGKIGKMTLTDAGLNFIKKNEGFRATAYPDPPGSGLYSIGYGHQIKKGEEYLKTATITEQEATKILKNDTQTTQDFINKNVKVPLTQDMFDALVDFGHSGLGYLANILTNVNAKDYVGAAKRMQKYNKYMKDGKLVELAGLTSRRQQESDKFLSSMTSAVAENKPSISSVDVGKPTEISETGQLIAQVPTPLPQSGIRLATASAQNTNLRTAPNNVPPTNNTLISPTTIAQTTNVLPGIRAQNTESTYQRIMNSQYVPA